MSVSPLEVEPKLQTMVARANLEPTSPTTSRVNALLRIVADDRLKRTGEGTVQSDVTAERINEWAGLMTLGYQVDLTEEALSGEPVVGESDDTIAMDALERWLTLIEEYLATPEHALYLYGNIVMHPNHHADDLVQANLNLIADRRSMAQIRYLDLLIAISEERFSIIPMTNRIEGFLFTSEDGETGLLGPLLFTDNLDTLPRIP